MRLTDEDRAVLAGERGSASRIALDLVVTSGEAMGAAGLLDIVGGHIDGCLYHGIVGLDFANKLAKAGGRVAVPTTLNVSSLDLLHPDLYRGNPEDAKRSRALMTAYENMGCRPSWTCAPYQLADRPGLGDHVAWGESNAIVFANSVLGARTNRYGDFLDICCALTGRAPAVGLHTDEGRRATLGLEVAVPDSWLDNDLLYVAVGLILGRLAGTQVTTITGLDDRADEDRLKALGAAAASTGAVGMFHVAGVTPEADSLGMSPTSRIVVDRTAIAAEMTAMNRSGGSLGAVSVGTPHASRAEMERLADLCAGRRTKVPFYVSTGREVLASCPEAVAKIDEFGASIVTDTCTYITPIIGDVSGVVLTNSGKWAYYAPGNLGLEVTLGTLSDCVESAVRGQVLVSGELS